MSKSSLMKAVFFLQIGAELLGNLCKVCGKVFNGRNWKQNLEYHFLTHTKEKPFKCPICPHRSALKYNLIRHIRNRHRDILNPGLQNNPSKSESTEDMQLKAVHSNRLLPYWDVDIMRSQRSEVSSREVQMPLYPSNQSSASQEVTTTLNNDVQVSLSQESSVPLNQNVVSRGQDIFLGSDQEGHMGMSNSVRDICPSVSQDLNIPNNQAMNMIQNRGNSGSCSGNIEIASNQDIGLHATQAMTMNPSHEINVALSQHNQGLVSQEIDQLPKQECQISIEQGNLQHLEQ